LPAPRAMRADMHGWPRRSRTASSTKLPEAGPALALPPAADDRLAGVFWPQPLSLGPAGSRAFETHPPCCFGRMSLPGQFKLCTACPAQVRSEQNQTSKVILARVAAKRRNSRAGGNPGGQINGDRYKPIRGNLGDRDKPIRGNLNESATGAWVAAGQPSDRCTKPV
jgi:hypothetical protein